MVEACILSIQTVPPLQGSYHPVTVNDPTHLTTSTGGTHIPTIQGKDTSWIESKTQFKRMESNSIIRLLFYTVTFYFVI